MPVNLAKVTYFLEALRPDGQRLSLDTYIRWPRSAEAQWAGAPSVQLALVWEEQPDELAARIQARLRQARIGGQWLHQLLPLGAWLIVSADWGNGKQEVCRGTIFDWRYATGDGLTVTAYDPLIYLTKSKDDRVYRAGTKGQTIIEDIGRAWNIPIGRVDGPTIAVGKQVFRGDTLADMITTVLRRAKLRGGGNYLVRSTAGKLEVIKFGEGATDTWRLTHEDLVGRVEDRQDIEELVTRVTILGHANEDERAPVVAVKEGRTEFGRLQEILREEEFDPDTPGAASQAAAEILAERGQPRKRRIIEAVDLPWLRKGDKVEIAAGTLVGTFGVTGVSHDADTRTMTLEVEEFAG